MKTIFTIGALFLTIFSFGQTTFRTGINAKKYAELYDLVQLNDGTFVAVGYTEQYSDSDNFYTDYAYLVKLNAQGIVTGSKTISGDEIYSPEAIDIIKTSDGNIAVSGTLNDQIALFKFDNNLNLLWSKQYSLSDSYGDGARLLQTNDGGYFVVGDLVDSNNANEVGLLLKTDKDGNVSWSKQYFGFTDNSNDNTITDIVATKDGNYAFLGYSNSSSNSADTAYVVKINGSGNIIWSRYLTTTGFFYQQAISLLASSDGGLVASGTIEKNYLSTDNSYTSEILMFKFSQDGNLLWSKYSDNGLDNDSYAWGLVEDKDGGYITSGDIDSYVSDETERSYLLKVNSSGVLQTTKTYIDANNSSYFYGLTKTSDGGFAASGDIYSDDDDNLDGGLVFKLNSDLSTCGTTGTFGNLIDLPVITAAKSPSVSDVVLTVSNGSVTIGSDATGINLCSTLPLQLLSFNATLQNKSVNIEWKTANEINTDYFTVERSNNTTSFTALQKVTAKGNSSNVQTYTTTDLQPMFGTSYYRLKEVDKDGKASYSNIVPVTVSANGTIVISPNPVRDNIRVLLQSKENSSLYFQIADMTGKTLITQRATVNAGTNTVIIPASSLSKGLYVLKVIQNNATQSIKFVKE